MLCLSLLTGSYISLTELQNARGIMDVLTEMLSALDPSNQEVQSHYTIKKLFMSDIAT